MGRVTVEGCTLGREQWCRIPFYVKNLSMALISTPTSQGFIITDPQIERKAFKESSPRPELSLFVFRKYFKCAY